MQSKSDTEHMVGDFKNTYSWMRGFWSGPASAVFSLKDRFSLGVLAHLFGTSSAKLSTCSYRTICFTVTISTPVIAIVTTIGMDNEYFALKANDILQNNATMST